MTNIKPKKCVIYARVSSKKQVNEGSGISSQIRSCKDYAAANNIQVLDVFTDVISGKYAKRPGFEGLVARLELEDPCDRYILFDDLNRFSRDVLAHYNMRNRLDEIGATPISPRFKFAKDPSSRFTETVMVAVGELDRLRNAETSDVRSRARMSEGYWHRRPPVGYKFGKAPGGGKMIVPDYPLASHVKEALESYADGRLQSISEVKRFLDKFPEIRNLSKTREIRLETVKSALENILYAGYLRYPRWNIPLTEGKHDALISMATHRIIQDRLSGKAIAPARKGLSSDFPLRGFLVCSECGYKITAAWSTNHQGKRYPYYVCQHRGCVVKGKSYARDRIEIDFLTLLQGIGPSVEQFDQVRQVFATAWEDRRAQIKAQKTKLSRDISKIEEDIETALTRMAATGNDSVAKAYEDRVDQKMRERAEIEAALENLQRPPVDFDKMFELALCFLANPSYAWINGGLAVKRTVLKLVYAEPMILAPKTGLRTAKMTLPFKALDHLSGMNYKLVPPHGTRLQFPANQAVSQIVITLCFPET